MRRTLALMSTLPLGVAIQAQTAPASATEVTAEAASTDTDVVVLDPFTVTTEHEGYQAVDTLAGGRVRTELRDTASAITVVTSKLMQDLGVTNAESLLVYTNNTEVAGLGGNFSGMSNRGSGVSVSSAAESNRLVNPTGVNRARGLTAMDNTRNYFPSDIPWDGYNINRVDISRGPNSFLFGVGSPSGISNVSTNEAAFTDKGNVEVHYGSFGSTRESLDYNKVLIPDELTVRLDLVNDKTLYRQEPAYNHTKRAYGALRFDPKFLSSDSAHTKILVNFENGEVRSNNPRTLPPFDYVTGYLSDPKASATGYNPWTYLLENSQPLSTVSAWTNNGSIGNEYQWGSSPHYYWDAETGALLRASQASWSAPTSANYGAAAAGLNNIYHVHTVGFSDYAKATNYYNSDLYKGAYGGTVTYLDKTLSDPSVFDFYNKLIDGDNKHEWQRWNTYQVSLVQSLFDNRLFIQAAADHQEYISGQEGFLNSRSPVIVLDLDQYLLTYPSWLSDKAQTNPNLGRPVIFGSAGTGSKDRTVRNNYQATAAWNLNFERDLGSKGIWGSILGRHEFTGLVSRNTKTKQSESYKLYGIDPAWAATYLGKTKLSDNGMTWQAYLGPSLLGTTGAGANLPNLSYSLVPSEYPVSAYVKTWTAGSSVDPTAAWTFNGPNGSTTLTQADNPANYAGYVGVPAAVLNSTLNRDQLRSGSSMTEQRITSKAFMYQGHFWDDVIVPSFGVRQDTTFQRGDVAAADTTTGYYSLIDHITDTGVSATTTSRSYGVAFHLPKAIKQRLPEGTDLSLYYFHGANQTPTVRYAIDGSELPNETGKTDDYAIQFDGLKGHLTVRLTYFKTIDQHAAASYGQPLGTMGWKIDSIPSWTLGFAAATLAARDNATLPSDFPTWMTGWGNEHPAELAAIEQTLKTDFIEMFPQSYWDQYGYTVNVDAIKRGDWLHVTTSAAWPSPWTLGGSHQVHGQFAVIDQDIESKGFELETTIRPIKNWDITLNASHATAKQTALGEAASRYLTGMAKLFMDSPLSKVAVWGGYSDYGATKQDFMQNLWAPYLQQVALTGSDQPEYRKNRFSVITNYKFDQSFLKGLNVGGAFRWLDKAIAGYGIHEATVYGEKAWISDVNQPIYAPSEQHFDAWIGYERPLTSKVTWRVQLNLRNVGETKGLVPIAYEPDGTVAQSRIQEGQTYDLSMKFMF